jgi:hypothetical protein
MEAGDEEARQHPRQAGDSAGTRQWDLSYSRAESAAAAGRRGPERRGDIKVSKHGNTWILDVGVVCPGTQRHVDQGSGTTPGLAAETYAAVKAAKYADQDNFVPFILETGGRVNKAARDWLDALTAPEPGEQARASRCPARTTTRGTRRRGRPLRPS